MAATCASGKAVPPGLTPKPVRMVPRSFVPSWRPDAASERLRPSMRESTLRAGSGAGGPRQEERVQHVQ